MATVKQPLPEVVSSEQWKAALDQLLVKDPGTGCTERRA